MIPEQEKRKRVRRPDSVTLSSESLNKLALWFSQIDAEIKGIKIQRSDLINWLVGSQSETLSSRQLSELKKKYFDEVKFAQWALTEVKRRKSRGEDVSLADLISSKPKRRKSNSGKTHRVNAPKKTQNHTPDPTQKLEKKEEKQ